MPDVDTSDECDTPDSESAPAQGAPLALESYRNPDGSAAVWIEPATWLDRAQAFSWRAALGAYAAFYSALISGGTAPTWGGWFWPLLFAGMVWAASAAGRRSSRRVFSREKRQLNLMERSALLAIWLYSGLLLWGGITYGLNTINFSLERSVSATILLTTIALSLVQLLPFRRSTLTVAAQSARKALGAREPLEMSEISQKLKSSLHMAGKEAVKPSLRWTFASGLFLMALHAAFAQPTSDYTTAGISLGVAAVLAFEATRWILAAAAVLAVGIFVLRGFASLPLSAAIIIGAVIIAISRS